MIHFDRIQFWPSTSTENRWHAHVMVRLPYNLGIPAVCSVGDIDREAYATGLQVSCDLWSNTAPNPNEDASAETFTSTRGS